MKIYVVFFRRLSKFIDLNEDLRQNQWGCLKLGQPHKIRLVLTSSFLTLPFQRYSSSNMTSRPVMLQTSIIFIGNSVVDSLSIVRDTFPVLT